MRLLTFAHRKEAQAFFEEKNFQLVPFIFDGLFKAESTTHETELILITGEGTQNASEKVTAVLGYFQSQIKIIINLGVAGSVSQNILKDNIYFIRTSYAHHADRLEFKSFTTHLNFIPIDLKIKSYDCMSLFERAITHHKRCELSHFAPIVDRELWAIGSAAHLFKIPFLGIKYISDDLNSEQFCQLVIEEAPHISKKLLNFYHQHANLSEEKEKSTDKKDEELPSKYFYLTVTQKRQLKNYLVILHSKNISLTDILQSSFYHELILEDITPKMRSKFLLEHLLTLINPFRTALKKEMEKTLAPLRSHHLDVHFDPQFEDETISISFKVKNDIELNQKIRTLQNFTFATIDKIFEGNFDV